MFTARRLFQCPSTLSEEKAYNPFLRTGEESLLKAMAIEKSKDGITDELRAQILAEIRVRKDKFKYKL